jgi:hypothetical protein
MSRIFHPLMYLLACSTRQELARQVQYLKTENEILRSKLPRRITVTPEECRKLVVLERAAVCCLTYQTRVRVVPTKDGLCTADLP